MLRCLSVENFALIEQLELELDARLNIITGETGAGKSILLGALGLLLGAKNDGTAMKNATKNCKVEGTFEIEGLNLESFFEENDLEYAPETTLTRILTPQGKSRAFVNDMPVTLQQIKALGSRLVDIHSQHQNLILSSEDFRTSALDTMADNEPLRQKYLKQYNLMQELSHEVNRLRDEAQQARRDEEWLRFQTEELNAAKLREGEQAEIEEECSLLEHADRIREAFLTLSNALDAEERGILSQLKTSENELQHISQNYAAAGEYSERLHAITEELKDINSSITGDCMRIDSDPERLTKLSTRLDTLISLEQKHHVNSEQELIEVRDKYRTQLALIEHSDEEISLKEEALRKAQEEAHTLADKLHATREKAAPKFAEECIHTLRKLGMEDTIFRIDTNPSKELTPSGYDHVAFLFSANKNHAPQPIERIASGGELSRVMLSLKVLLAKRMQLPTILFDEIDTGVSGRIADAMGEIIEDLSTSMQVVDITHLPQVASKGETHFVVYKEEGHTSITHLQREERIVEIAKMLSGSHISDAAMEQARILLGM